MYVLKAPPKSQTLSKKPKKVNPFQPIRIFTPGKVTHVSCTDCASCLFEAGCIARRRSLRQPVPGNGPRGRQTSRSEDSRRQEVRADHHARACLDSGRGHGTDAHRPVEHTVQVSDSAEEDVPRGSTGARTQGEESSCRDLPGRPLL